VEDEHHALVYCTQAAALRDLLREHWALPKESEFQKTGDEWFLHLIANAAPETRTKLLFMFWRAWHHRNNIIHGDGKASVLGSARFLQNYESSFREANSDETTSKGKKLIFPSQNLDNAIEATTSWTAPPLIQPW
jgi:hypothetical protein